MGWSFSCVDVGRKAHIESLTGQRHFSAEYKPLAHRVVGNNVWQCVEHLPTGRRFIALDLIAKDRNGGWGYKGLSEDAGPVEVNCPLSLLAMCTEPTEADGYAAAWREKVREYHARRKQRPEVKPGLIVEYGGNKYRLIEPWAPRKGWSVVSLTDGLTYRMKARQLAQARRIDASLGEEAAA